MTRLFLAIVLACYPFVVYLLLDNVAYPYLVLMFGALVALRLYFLSNMSNWIVAGSQLGLALFCAAAIVDPYQTVLKLYPALINLGAAAWCIYTLLNPPSAIQRISQLVGMRVDGPAVPYTRRLTMVWTGFFLVSAAVAGYTALATSTRTWAWYNGLISYLLIGLLIAGEYPVRLLYRKRHRLT